MKVITLEEETAKKKNVLLVLQSSYTNIARAVFTDFYIGFFLDQNLIIRKGMLWFQHFFENIYYLLLPVFLIFVSYRRPLVF